MEFFAHSLDELRGLQDPRPGPEEIVEDRLDGQRRARQLLALVRELPPAQRNALAAVYGLDGSSGSRSYRAAGVGLGRSASSVGSAIHRATRRLAETIDSDARLAELMRA